MLSLLVPLLCRGTTKWRWVNMQEGGEKRDCDYIESVEGGKGEDSMHKKRTRKGVWRLYIYNNMSIISLPSLLPPEPCTNGKQRIIPLKILKKYISERIRPFFHFQSQKFPPPSFFWPSSTVCLVDCSFFCHIFHHPKPFTSWGGVGRNHETQMNGGGVRENTDLLIYVSQQQQQQQQQ